ncbi:hypothetical protein AD998_06740 [bacterium 336/3]|nr:hypothetical protein AD998_06740 [bacterium 336/3]
MLIKLHFIDLNKFCLKLEKYNFFIEKIKPKVFFYKKTQKITCVLAFLFIPLCHQNQIRL